LPSGAEDISTICAECAREKDHSRSFLMQGRTIDDQALETQTAKPKERTKRRTKERTEPDCG